MHGGEFGNVALITLKGFTGVGVKLQGVTVREVLQHNRQRIQVCVHQRHLISILGCFYFQMAI